jgi:hypothetical protein
VASTVRTIESYQFTPRFECPLGLLIAIGLAWFIERVLNG